MIMNLLQSLWDLEILPNVAEIAKLIQKMLSYLLLLHHEIRIPFFLTAGA